MKNQGKKDWLRQAVFYEIYPTSFYDSDGDGIGDIKGIISKLDYIAGLNVNGIWLNPLFESPFRDGGYDITDYYKVDPRFGTNEDLKLLFAEAGKRGIKILLDLVPGHTSDKCEWFRKSSKPERNEYSDYYVWTDHVFEDSAGLKMVNGVSERNGNYVVNFFAMQPALNYGFANCVRPWQKHWTDKSFDKIHNQVTDIIKFWLKAGAAGFRVDMAGCLIKNDYTYEANAALWNKLFADVSKDYPQAIFVSEWSMPGVAVGKAGFDMDFLIHIHGEAYNSLFRSEKLSRPFGDIDRASYFRKNSDATLETFFTDFLKEQGSLNGNGFISVPTGNHDLSRIGEGRTDAEIIAAYAFLMTIPSVPFVYYGDEIGMRGVPGLSKDGGYIRTPARTPMQWNGSKNCGFSTAEQTYLPADNDYVHTVEAQEKQGSILDHTRKLIKLRRELSALTADADFRFVSALHDNPFVYERQNGKEKLLIAINAKGGKAESGCQAGGEVLASLNATFKGGRIDFEDNGYIIIKLT